jgi:hypothetical protein
VHIEDRELVSTLTEQTKGGPLLGAVYARFDTPLSFTRWLTPLGNYLVARPAARAEAAKTSGETGVPLDAAVVFGVSATDLHVWSADIMLSQVNQYLGAVPRDQIAKVSTTAGKSWQGLTIAMANGSTIEVEARGGVHAFVSAFES